MTCHGRGAVAGGRHGDARGDAVAGRRVVAVQARWRTVAVVCAVVALDDVAEHALGVWTPLDAGWRQVYHLVP